jgi:2-polyprenyl-6-hydroxyphenyl methylase/3-demethylubiquinone-9 3-methyltransferase
MLKDVGLKVTATRGMSFSVLTWTWQLTSDTDINYLVVAEKPRANT